LLRFFHLICPKALNYVKKSAGGGMPNGVFHRSPRKASAQTLKAFLPCGRGFFALTMMRGNTVQPDEEIILRYAKEIIIKFIELG
jgi:hypothetical protein